MKLTVMQARLGASINSLAASHAEVRVDYLKLKCSVF